MNTDWNEIRRRIEAAAEALARAAEPSAEEQRLILKERALALSREPEQTGTAGESLEVVEFRLASEVYAVESVFVREVQPLKDLTPLPSTPSFVLGIVNLRGRILSVVDPRVFFGLRERGLGDLNKLVVIGDDRMEFGILADGVAGTRRIPRGAIQPPLPGLTGIGAEYLRGIGDAETIILDAERILGDERIVIFEEA
ncbi:MAG: chemotaxis protein CheW [Rectinemataceae bacterium]